MARPMMVRRAVQRYRAVSQVLWTPLNLGTALVAWWDPTQGLTMNGLTVASWVDRAGGISASQSTASAQPSVSSTARNGKPGVVFNGSSQFFSFIPSSAFPSGSGPSTIFLAMYVPSDSAVHQALIIGDQGNTVRGFAIRQSKLSVGINNADFNTTINVGGADSAALWSQSGGTATVSTDGGTKQAGSINVNNNLNNGTIGRASPSNYAGEFFSQVIQQIVVVNRVLTTSETNKLLGWESWNDGKAGSNLSSASPYKSRAPYVSDP